MTTPCTHKLVAIMNEKIEPGILMNALAHMCIGLGASLGKEPLRLTEYVDKNDGVHPNISEMPFIILKANSNKIRNVRLLAQKEAGITAIDFTDTMTVGTYVEQIAKTKETLEENLIYYGIVLYGEWNVVSELTKKFSLWK